MLFQISGITGYESVFGLIFPCFKSLTVLLQSADFNTAVFLPSTGILSQELTDYMHDKFPGNYTSYIAASYVKYVEGAGARVVPIK
jgi:hypothetical protein